MTFGHFGFLLLTTGLISAPIALAADPAVFISEVQIAGDATDDEFIELSNNGDSDIDLSGFQLRRKTSGGTESSIKVFEKNSTIKSKGHFLWANSDGIFKSPFADAETSSSALASDNSIALYTKSGPTGILIDTVAWGNGKPFLDTTTILGNPQKNTSIIRDSVIQSWSETKSPTPTNSHGQTFSKPTPPPPTQGKANIRINELLPNPLGKDTGSEWIELFHPGPEDLALTGWTFTKKNGVPIDIKEPKITARGFLIIPLSLINSQDIISLLDPEKNIVSQVAYTKTVEGASLNFTANGYRWSRAITKGSENILNTPPEKRGTDIPGSGFRDVPVSFTASAKDRDGEKIKYRWDFGDGHKSTKAKTTHTYTAEGTYQGSLTISDGTEDDTTVFTITIEDYEAPKVRMTEVSPNPSGKDTDTEYITIENRSKKEVDLIDWSIATGWKKLVNHKIQESFIIPKKSSRNITHEFSAFTLPNEKVRIELRSPDGKVVQKLKYNLKGKSVEEDTRFVKKKGKKWEWTTGQPTNGSKPSFAKASDGQGSEPKIIPPEEKQLEKDTKTITQKKSQGENLVSTEENLDDEMRKLIGFGTDIETPLAVLTLSPRVAGIQDEIMPMKIPKPDTDFTFNSLINSMLERE